MFIPDDVFNKLKEDSIRYAQELGQGDDANYQSYIARDWFMGAQAGYRYAMELAEKPDTD